MKTKKVISIVVLLTVILSWIFTNVTYAQWGSWGWGWSSSWWSSSGWSSDWWSSSGWSSDWWSSSTWWDSSGSDSTWWDNTWWDYSSWGWTDTWWDSSGSNSTWWDSTWWDSSGSQNNHWQSWFPSGWWDKIRNVYWEAIQLKARISQNSIDKANNIMNKIIISSFSLTSLQRHNKLMNELNNVDYINLWDLNLNEALEASKYLKLRLQYKIWIYEELWKLEGNMNQETIQLTNNFAYKFKFKYFYDLDSKRMMEYERLLWLILKVQAQVGNINTTQENKNRIQNILKYLEVKMYEEIEDLENS